MLAENFDEENMRKVARDMAEASTMTADEALEALKRAVIGDLEFRWEFYSNPFWPHDHYFRTTKNPS